MPEFSYPTIVVPTGFITAQTGIDRKIREKLVDEKILAGVVSMPSNIFATIRFLMQVSDVKPIRRILCPNG